MNDRATSTGALALVSAGVAAAFALAACCALPMLLVGVGIGAYWLAPIAELGQRFDGALTAVAVLALAGAVIVMLRAPRTCAPGDLCGRPMFRVGIIALSGVGAVLLVLSKTYA